MLFQIFLQVIFYCLVDGLYLPITLGVLEGGEHFLYPKLFTQGDEF